jgi:predicted phosphodiesterase
MRFRLMSDLHLEFQNNVIDFTPIPLQEDMDTVLILAGDIAVGFDAVPFIERMCRQFYKVVYILGNHEFYHNEVNKTKKRWKEYAENDAPDNFIFLDDNVAMVENVRLVGGTLWTDFDSENWFAMNEARNGMNDFYCVKIKEGHPETGYRKRRWLPEDAVRAHKMTLFTITETVRVPHDGPTVVITHHLPHPLCVDQAYRTHPLNPAYMSNLDMYIEEYDIDVWVHGHTHSNVDVEVHGTRILCNPRGYYPNDLNGDFDEKFSFEV